MSVLPLPLLRLRPLLRAMMGLLLALAWRAMMLAVHGTLGLVLLAGPLPWVLWYLRFGLLLLVALAHVTCHRDLGLLLCDLLVVPPRRARSVVRRQSRSMLVGLVRLCVLLALCALATPLALIGDGTRAAGYELAKLPWRDCSAASRRLPEDALPRRGWASLLMHVGVS